MRYGTCNFESFTAAVTYYRRYGFSKEDVADKLDAGEIRVGRPGAPPNANIYLNEGRYIVEMVR